MFFPKITSFDKTQLCTFTLAVTEYRKEKDEAKKRNVNFFKNCIKTKKKLIKVKNGNHSLSRKSDLKKICSELNNMISKHC